MKYCDVFFDSIDIDDLLKTGHSYVRLYDQGRRFIDLAFFYLVPPGEIGINDADIEDWARRCIEHSAEKTAAIFEANFKAGADQLKNGPSFAHVINVEDDDDFASPWLDWLNSKGYWMYDYPAYGVSLLSLVDNLEKSLKHGSINSALNAVSNLHITAEQSRMLDFALEAGKQGAKEIARLRSLIRHRDGPKAAEKRFVYECWQDWQAKPHLYKSKAAFCRDMLEKCEHLTSTKKIEDWTREWANGEKPSP